MPVPPRAVRFNAQKGLDIRAEQTPSNRAGTPVGLARARDLAAGVNVSEETIRRMVAFFNRHQQNWDPTDLTQKKALRLGCYGAELLAADGQRQS